MSLKTNFYFKIGAIVLLVMLLLIPATMIKGLIQEREQNQKDATLEISSKWGLQQTLIGPFISIPYTKMVREVQDGKPDTYTEVQEYIHLMPAQLSIKGEVNPEKRYRGIYEIVVYQSLLNIQGSFSDKELATLGIAKEDIHFDKAELVMGISDLRGIEKQVELIWDSKKILFSPGVSSNDVVVNGIHAPISWNPTDTGELAFQLSLDLKGSEWLQFAPVGKVSDVQLSSSWVSPSFNGSFLPDKRDISAKGFTANWNILNLNRVYPQIWVGEKYNLNQSTFGLDLLVPVDNYQMATRSIKYAILFIGLTFLVFFFIEVMNKVFIHPIQYLLVGAALVIFYVLLLSISEHLHFNLAFFIAASGTLVLISGYVRAILKSTPLTILMAGILIVMYTFLFSIIQMEDSSLLIGSIGIFLILGLVMYFSRKIDWYGLNVKSPQPPSSESDV